jgi:hypothetical protein
MFFLHRQIVILDKLCDVAGFKAGQNTFPDSLLSYSARVTELGDCFASICRAKPLFRFLRIFLNEDEEC